MRVAVRSLSGKAIFSLCMMSFFVGLLFSDRMWMTGGGGGRRLVEVLRGSDRETKHVLGEGHYSRDVMGEVTKTHEAIKALDKTISTLEMELAASRTSGTRGSAGLRKAFVVIGINTGFSRSTLRRLEKEKGIVIRFVIGHSATPGGILDRAIDAEESETKDFLRLNHVEGYHKLSTKTRLYFSTVVSIWDADFYVKVDDDVHVNLGMLVTTLARYRSKPRIYIGCMKSGPVLFQKPILHRYANEDVSLGSWIFGLDVEHVNDRTMCCGTPPDCEWKTQAWNVCVASFDWSCSGVCKSVERMMEVHNSCGEGDGAVWNAVL
ncbi:putative beta-1,3-galactosyltransferase 8 [Acorus calamus]|uniref:Hexosyltransferase n=1 Tax=Acorus calamus TaxID=4465 RepID=A0AAV9CE05_ACOCL|nr:putative beta-1,3-galactosyltransferase 8 [Acorus calamus]